MIGKLRGVVDSLETISSFSTWPASLCVNCSSAPCSICRAPANRRRSHRDAGARDSIRCSAFRRARARLVRLLQSVQGVAPRSRWRFCRSCPRTNWQRDSDAGQGDGLARFGRRPKLAARIVAELKDKAPARLGRPGGGAAGREERRARLRRCGPISALCNLGYGRRSGRGVAASASAGRGRDASALIRGLKSWRVNRGQSADAFGATLPIPNATLASAGRS